MDDATKLAESVKALIEVVGFWKLILFAALTVVGLISHSVYRHRQADSALREVVTAKNETIERIAQQNRELRLELLTKGGMNLKDAYRIVYDKPLEDVPVRPAATVPPTQKKAPKEGHR